MCIVRPDYHWVHHMPSTPAFACSPEHTQEPVNLLCQNIASHHSSLSSNVTSSTAFPDHPSLSSQNSFLFSLKHIISNCYSLLLACTLHKGWGFVTSFTTLSQCLGISWCVLGACAFVETELIKQTKKWKLMIA